MDEYMERIHLQGYEIGYGGALKTVIESKVFSVKQLSEVLNMSETEIRRLIRKNKKHEKEVAEYKSQQQTQKAKGISMYDIFEKIKEMDAQKGQRSANEDMIRNLIEKHTVLIIEQMAKLLGLTESEVSEIAKRGQIKNLNYNFNALN